MHDADPDGAEGAKAMESTRHASGGHPVPVIDVALVIPDGTPQAGGNTVTANRLADALEREGLSAGVFWASEARPPSLLVHAFNAVATAVPLLRQGVSPERLVVTWTGTDLWSGGWEDDVLPLLSLVRHHTVLTPDAVGILTERFQGARAQFRHIAPGVDLHHFNPAGPVAALPHPVAMLVGAVRPVKGTRRAIDLVEGYRRTRHIDLTLAIVGPMRDAEYGRELEPLMAARPWILQAGEIGRRDLPLWLRAADLILNTSDSEGLSNALLEALATGRPVVARDIPGNRALLGPSQAGWLFQTPEQFGAAVDDVLSNPDTARERCLNGRVCVDRHFQGQREAQAFVVVYEDAGLADRAADRQERSCP